MFVRVLNTIGAPFCAAASCNGPGERQKVLSSHSPGGKDMDPNFWAPKPLCLSPKPSKKGTKGAPPKIAKASGGGKKTPTRQETPCQTGNPPRLCRTRLGIGQRDEPYESPPSGTPTKPRRETQLEPVTNWAR